MRDKHWRTSAFSCLIVHHDHGLSYPFPVSHFPLSCHGYMLGGKTHVQAPRCVLQVCCRLFAFANYGLTRCILPLLSKDLGAPALCTGSCSGIDHFPAQGCGQGPHLSLMMSTAGYCWHGEKEKELTRRMHILLCRQDCNEGMNWHHALTLVWLHLSSVEKSTSQSIPLPSVPVCIFLMYICSSVK